MSKNKIMLEQRELHVMEYLWRQSPQTEEQLYSALKLHPGVRKGKVKILLNRLADKGAVYYEEEAGGKQYFPQVSRENIEIGESEILLQREMYRSSASVLVNKASLPG